MIDDLIFTFFRLPILQIALGTLLFIKLITFLMYRSRSWGFAQFIYFDYAAKISVSDTKRMAVIKVQNVLSNIVLLLLALNVALYVIMR
jgi:hypothetical protein